MALLVNPKGKLTVTYRRIEKGIGHPERVEIIDNDKLWIEITLNAFIKEYKIRGKRRSYRYIKNQKALVLRYDHKDGTTRVMVITL
jgi:hypothetical protein